MDGENAFGARRARARQGLAALIGVMGFFYLSIGLMRAQETFTPSFSLQAIAQMFLTPEALMLVIFSALIGVTSYRKAFTAFDDACPGLGSRQRREDTARAAAHDLYADFEAEIVAGFDDQYDQLNAGWKAQQGTREASKEASRALAEAATTLDRAVDTAGTEMTEQQEVLLGYYAAANGGAPHGIPKKRLAELTNFERYRPDPLPDIDVVTTYDALHQDIARQRQEALRALAACFNRHFNQFGDRQ